MELGCATVKSPVLINFNSKLVVKSNKEFETLKKVSRIPETNLQSYLSSPLARKRVCCAFTFRGFRHFLLLQTPAKKALPAPGSSPTLSGKPRCQAVLVSFPTGTYITQWDSHHCAHDISPAVAAADEPKKATHTTKCSLSAHEASETFLEPGIHGFGFPPNC